MLYEIYRRKPEGLGRLMDGGVWLVLETDDEMVAKKMAIARGGFVLRTSDGWTWTPIGGTWKAPDRAYKRG